MAQLSDIGYGRETMNRLNGKKAVVRAVSRTSDMREPIARCFLSTISQVVVSGLGRPGHDSFARELGARAIPYVGSSKPSVMALFAEVKTQIWRANVAASIVAASR